MGRTVWVAAVLALVSRFPSMLWPLRPDEAGFLMVARSWDPRPDSLYGPYWVDRPPPVIWLYRLTDQLGGPYAHRVLGAVGCALLVVAAAAAAREVALRAGLTDEAALRRVTGWVALATAALVGNAQIDSAAAKGELFGIPLVMASCWLSLRAVRRASALEAFGAGVLAMLAVGMKQSIVGGLVFGAVLLLGAVATRRLPLRDGLRCAVAAVVGAALPVAATVGWALAAGIRLGTLWYDSVAFRSDASRVLAASDSPAAAERITVLALIFVTTGMVLVVACFLVRLPALLRTDPVPVVATAATVALDLVAVAVSGSYWSPYLFVPLPGLALALALVLAHERAAGATTGHGLRRLTTRAVVAVVVASSMVSLAGWTAGWVRGRVPVEARTGEAIAAATRPGDQVLVYGGRADIQWYTGAESPYPYLWSLPMRTLDPDLAQLEQVLTGDDPPTWFVEATYINTWSELGTRPIERSLIRKYEFVRTACDRYRVYHLNTVDPVDVDVDCTTPFRTVWGR